MYQIKITAILAPYPQYAQLDPRLIEALMREDSPTLDHLSAAQFEDEALGAAWFVTSDIESQRLAARLATSYGLL